MSKAEVTLNDLIDQWHESDSVKDLYEILGTTQKEFADWVGDSRKFPDSIGVRLAELNDKTE